VPNGKWLQKIEKEVRTMTPILNMHDINVSEFLAVLDTCEGNVFLVTRDGDKLNLRSKLSQLVGLTQLIEGGRIAEASIVCENKNDECKLFRLNMFRDVG
jgi:hypothetical protein